jgi:hypothetical protein
MPVLDRALDPDPGLEQVPVRVPVPELEQVPVPGLAQGLEQVQVMEQAAQAWVLDQGQVLVREALGLVARMDRMATDLVMEPATLVLVRQTVQAMAQAMARVRADLGRAPAANNSTPPSLL